MSPIKSKDYLGRTCVLRRAAGEPVLQGEEVTDFRGEVWLALGGPAPHKPGSTGRIVVRQVGPVSFYPSVFDCAWVVLP